MAAAFILFEVQITCSKLEIMADEISEATLKEEIDSKLTWRVLFYTKIWSKLDSKRIVAFPGSKMASCKMFHEVVYCIQLN